MAADAEMGIARASLDPTIRRDFEPADKTGVVTFRDGCSCKRVGIPLLKTVRDGQIVTDGAISESSVKCQVRGDVAAQGRAGGGGGLRALDQQEA